jgi:probable F420-dependent oxidoreductase
MKIAVWAPMQIWSDLRYEHTRILRDFARRVEDLGFAGLWTYDHLVKGSGLYSVGWLEQLTVLAHAAACTVSIDLGTAVVVAPVREPVLLAKQLATMQYLSGGRVVFGAGAGWNPKEFEAVGARLNERGRRTDEVLEIVSRLLTGEVLSWDSEFYRFDEVEVEPALPQPQPIWYGGGSKPSPGGDRPGVGLAPAVLRRIVHADGWISRGAAPLEVIIDDWATIRQESARVGRAAPTFAHCNYLHVVDAPSRDTVIDEQVRAYRRILGPDATEESIAATHFTGTIDDIATDLQRYADAGVEYLILGVLDYLPEQLDLWAEHLLPQFAG